MTADWVYRGPADEYRRLSDMAITAQLSYPRRTASNAAGKRVVFPGVQVTCQTWLVC